MGATPHIEHLIGCHDVGRVVRGNLVQLGWIPSDGNASSGGDEQRSYRLTSPGVFLDDRHVEPVFSPGIHEREYVHAAWSCERDQE